MSIREVLSNSIATDLGLFIFGTTMPAFVNTVGKRFGKLVVKREISGSRKIRTRVECLCDCGVIKIIWKCNVMSVKQVSCSCHKNYQAKIGHTTHGLRHSNEYHIWHNMIQRCHDKKSKSYKNYGQRGIYVCKKWRQSFLAFYKDVGKRPSKKYSLDRINNNKGYYPSNVKWSTAFEQQNNTRTNRIIRLGDKKFTMTQFSRHYSIRYTFVRSRMDRGRTARQIIQDYKAACRQ